MTRPRVVEVHIEELVLHGFAAADRHRLADAIQAELARRFEHGLPRALERPIPIAHVDAGAFRVAQPPRPAAVGAQIAGAITHALDAPTAADGGNKP